MTGGRERPERVAVTGAGGYVGARVVHDAGGFPVRALVRRDAAHLAGVEQRSLDLAGAPEAIHAALEGVGRVLHLAGHNEVIAAREPERALDETTRATEQLVAAATAAGVRRLVYVSTVHVYGAAIGEDAVVDETVTPEPTSAYAASRWRCEQVLAAAGDALEVVVLRLSNAVGAPVAPAVDRWTLVASDLCRQAATGGRLALRTAGLQWRDFVALDDVSRLVRTCVTDDTVPPGTYNLASGRPATVRALAELVQDTFERLTGERPPLDAPAPEGPPPRPHRISVDRLAAHGLRADTPVADAVEDLARFCLTHRQELR